MKSLPTNERAIWKAINQSINQNESAISSKHLSNKLQKKKKKIENISKNPKSDLTLHNSVILTCEMGIQESGALNQYLCQIFFHAHKKILVQGLLSSSRPPFERGNQEVDVQTIVKIMQKTCEMRTKF